MAPIRDDLDYYGDRPADWTPFDPHGSEPLVRRAQAVASEHRFRSDVVDDLEQLGAVLDRAEAEGGLVVLLLDAWSVRLEAARRALAEVDRRSGAVAVVAPISAGDPESFREKGHLGTGVLRMLVRRGRRGDTMVRVGPDSSETFDEQLGRILEATRNRSYRFAQVRRTGPATSAGTARTLPMLDVP
jgi:FxsC-like protein